jgi:glucosamine-6-phosphate deaminase
MKVVILDEPQDVARYGVDIFRDQLQAKPDSVFGLATGSTPLSLYRELIESNRREEISFRQVRTFNLDEYMDLGPDHPQSYRHFMDREFFDHIDIDKSNTRVPPGDAANPLTACVDYEQAIIDAGGIDIQLLGIGRNGHIGFNEPTSCLTSRTRVKTLTEETIEDNARFFKSANEVPQHCITMGIGTIMEARQIVLLAFGERKAKAVLQVVEGPVSAMWPATILQMHPSVVVLLDEAAAANLEQREYYREVAANKPGWQRI